MRRLGELLIRRGVIKQSDLDAAANTQREFGGFLGPALVRLGAISEDAWLTAVSDELHLQIISRDQMPSAEAVRAAAERLRASPAWLIQKEAVIWLARVDGQERVHLAARHPYDPAVQEAAEQWRVHQSGVFLARSDDLDVVLSALNLPAESAIEGATDLARLRELAEEAPVIDFVNGMFSEAVARRASDVHIEAFEQSFAVRLRIDGVLSEWRRGPRGLFDAVSSRIKLLSGIDIAERRLPQDGRQSIRIAGKELDMRVSTLPSTWGESIVLRLLGKTSNLPELDALGLDPAQAAALTGMVDAANGVVLVTGPTGSGKTTTVYRLLTRLNDGKRKILTVEDPVEMDLPGVNQMRVRQEIGLTFAAGLRAILRQDPDVIMVGEIRDSETARIAVQAALTGHLVISTVHTNSALGAVARLMDLGIENYLLADVLRGVVGQRLVRKVCETCAQPTPATEDEAFVRARLPDLPAEAARWRVGAGCPSCSQTGFRGRIGVFEVAATDAQLRAGVRDRIGEAALEAIARKSGFRSMLEDGLLKARSGSTTLQEALRVLSA